jgi:hypothetical protein
MRLNQTHNPLLRAVPLSPASRDAAPAPDSRSWAAAVFAGGDLLHPWRRCVRDLVQGTRTSSSKPPSTRVDSVGARPSQGGTIKLVVSGPGPRQAFPFLDRNLNGLHGELDYQPPV